MTRLLLIFVLLTQMGCAVVQTAVGTLVGGVGVELVKHELEKDDEEAPQP